jgi:hypothetical protein
MSAPRITIRNCSDPRDHAIHVSDARRSMYEVEEDLVVYLCPGGRAGDKRIRESGDIRALAVEVWHEQEARKAPRENSVENDDYDGPDEGDYDADYEADRAADRYEHWLFRD